MTQRYDIAAYYWPAYHDEPRWRPFMPEGQGEWETVRKAAPKFDGHWQPRVPAWGYLDEADPRVMERKIAAAAEHNVNVIIFDWYWYDNQPFLEDALNRGYLQAGNNADVKFFLMWANHDASTLWDLQRSHEHKVIYPGAVNRAVFETIARRWIDRYFAHPSYYRIDGKPVVSIYEVHTLLHGLGGLGPTRDALDWLRRAVEAAGFPGLHLQAVLWRSIPDSPSTVPGDSSCNQANTVAALGFDSLTNYQWCHYVHAKGPYAAWGEQALAAWPAWAREFSVPFFPHVSIGWDTNPRFPRQLHDVVTGGTPEQFAAFLARAIDHVDSHALSPRLITVNAWNEWSESSYLEPDTVFGLRYLRAVRDTLAARNAR